MMYIEETKLSEEVLEELISMSIDWEKEDSCHGYRRNQKEDIQGNRIFLAKDGDEILGYLFGYGEVQEKHSSVIEEGKKCFEVMEIYVKPNYRDKGVGRKLFEYMEEKVDVDYLTLSTATKNYRAILRFYIEYLGLDFWSARLFKKMK